VERLGKASDFFLQLFNLIVRGSRQMLLKISHFRQLLTYTLRKREKLGTTNKIGIIEKMKAKVQTNKI
jgi:hypothetical protein